MSKNNKPQTSAKKKSVKPAFKTKIIEQPKTADEPLAVEDKNQAEFDHFAADYRAQQDQYLWAAGESSEYFAEYKVRKLVEWLPELQNEAIKILDFGCGDGLMTEYLRRYFLYAEIYGADISAASIEIAQQNVQNVSFSTIKNNNIDHQTESFDLIVTAGVFHHIKPEEHQLWCDKLHQLIKPGGKLVIFELNPLNPGTQLIFRNHPMEKNAQMLWPWQTSGLLKKFVTHKTNFYGFFPRWFKFLRCLEPWITKIPFGGLYACIAQK